MNSLKVSYDGLKRNHLGYININRVNSGEKLSVSVVVCLLNYIYIFCPCSTKSYIWFGGVILFTMLIMKGCWIPHVTHSKNCREKSHSSLSFDGLVLFISTCGQKQQNEDDWFSVLPVRAVRRHWTSMLL